jgi:Tfp pilus assembly protein FimV
MKLSPRAHAAILLCGVALIPCWLAGHAQAETQARPPSATSPALPSQQLRTYKPKPGESLDRVIANTMADSPLRIELLRQAYIESNPGAFLQGKAPQLRKNVALTVPNHEQLLKRFLPPMASSDAVQLPVTGSSSEERRRWVQYP